MIKKIVSVAVAFLFAMPSSVAVDTLTLAKTKVKVTPSPSPSWPPKGFIKSKDGNTFAKIPTPKELVGLASNDKVLTRALAKKVDGVPVCEKYSCGAVQVASIIGCTWWAITAEVQGVTSLEDKQRKTYGVVRTTAGESGPKKYKTILIVSAELIELHHSVTNIKAICHHDVPSEKVPNTTYTVNP